MKIYFAAQRLMHTDAVGQNIILFLLNAIFL